MSAVSGCRAIAAALLLVCGPAEAREIDFLTCDGRTAPGRADDGMGQVIPTSDHRTMLVALVTSADETGKRLEAACAHALADRRLTAVTPLRRTHLLRARRSPA